MITFKQYLTEAETDQVHADVAEAAGVFARNCKQWKDVKVPLYRITDSHHENGAHPMRTRVPRERQLASVGGSGSFQAWLFKQKGWSEFPHRRQSIFCSTRKEFEVGDDEGDNLLMIYPFDGVKLAITDANDFNYIQVKWSDGQFHRSNIMDIEGQIRRNFSYYFNNQSFSTPFEKMFNDLYETFVKNGKFDPTAGGNEKYAALHARLPNDSKKSFEALVVNLEDNVSPEKLGVHLESSATLDLPGPTREVWFSGKYLAIPQQYHKDFVKEVKAIQKMKQSLRKKATS